MSSLQDRIEKLEADVLSSPLRISAYHDLPFAIFAYPPTLERDMRQRVSLFGTRLQNAGKKVHYISIAELLWEAIEKTEGIEAIAEEEQQLGFARAQQTVCTLLSDPSFYPLPTSLSRRMRNLDPSKDVVLLIRVGALAPGLYRSAKLLDEMHGKTMTPIILFYPGSVEGESSLRFMDMSDREHTGAYNYRVRIY